MLFVGEQKSFLHILLETCQCHAFFPLRDLEQLLEQNDHKFDHLLMLLRSLFFLEDFVHVEDESFDDFWRQEVLFIRVELAEQINFHPALAVLIGQFSQLHEKH